MASTWPELHSGTNFNYVWDAGTLAWIKQVNASGGVATNVVVDSGTIAALTDGTQKTYISDGATNANVAPASSGPPAASTKALVVTVRDTVTVAVAGTVGVTTASPLDVTGSIFADGSQYTNIFGNGGTAGTSAGGEDFAAASKIALVVSVRDRGQATKADSIPVALASDQGTLAVSLATAPTTPVTNAGTFAVQDEWEFHTTGAIAAAGSSVTLDGRGTRMMMVAITATTASAGTVSFQGSVDNVTWFSLPQGGNYTSLTPPTFTGGVSSVGTTAILQTVGYPYLRAYSAAGLTGSITVAMTASRTSHTLETTDYWLKFIYDQLSVTGGTTITTGTATTAIASATAPRITELDFNGSADQLLYFGTADAASLTSDPVWQIKKFAYTPVTLTLASVLYADGVSTYTKAWDDRATYTYS